MVNETCRNNFLLRELKYEISIFVCFTVWVTYLCATMYLSDYVDVRIVGMLQYFKNINVRTDKDLKIMSSYPFHSIIWAYNCYTIVTYLFSILLNYVKTMRK